MLAYIKTCQRPLDLGISKIVIKWVLNFTTSYSCYMTANWAVAGSISFSNNKQYVHMPNKVTC